MDKRICRSGELRESFEEGQNRSFGRGLIETDHCGLQNMKDGRMKNAGVLSYKGCNNVESGYPSRGFV